MRQDVQYMGQPIGTILWETDGYGVQVSLDCAIPGDPLLLLRCYGQTQTTPFLIGLPEPLHGRLQLKRRLSRETLKEAGCLETPPTAFYLSENGAPPEIISEPPKQPEPSSVSTERPKVISEPREQSEPPSDSTEQPEVISKSPEQSEQPEVSDYTLSETPLCTGDDILDELLQCGDVISAVCGETIILRCPFVPDQPFALAPAFVLCAVRGREAILRWHTDANEKSQI